MKYLILLTSVLIQLCLGGVYAWSGLVPALESTTSLSVADTQYIFGCLFGAFTLSMVLAGKLLDRLGPAPVAGIGGLLFGAGYVLASFSGGNFLVMWLGVSLLTGIGTGFGYVCPLATCMRWFPNRRGLVTGISMAGFGGGAVVFSALAEYLLSGGVHVLVVLRWIGLAYGVVLLVSAATLRFPAGSDRKRVRPAPAVRHLLRDPYFALLVVGMFCGTFAGMLVIGNLKPIAQAAGLASLPATATISAFAIGNAAGRITWGWISDRTDERMIPLKLATLGVPLAMMAVVKMPPLFIVLAFLVGFGFGACFVVYAARVASRYGPDRVGSIYPMVFLAYGAAGILGPAMGGWLYGRTSSYTPAIVLSCAVVGLGMLAGGVLLRQARTTAAPQPCG